MTADGQPRNAVTVMFTFAAILLCTILPSQVAFTSLISAGGIPTIAAYGLIAILRLTATPGHFKTSHYYLGKWAKPFYLSAAVFNAIVFAVMISPFSFPVTADTFNFVSSRRICFVVQVTDYETVGVCDLGCSDHYGRPVLLAIPRRALVAPRSDH